MSLTEEKIIQLEYKLLEAIQSSDIDFLETYLHDDLLFIVPDGQTITKKIDLEFHKSKQMIIEKITPTFENISIIKDTAIVTVVYRTKGTIAENHIDGEFKYIRFWKQFIDEIKIIGGSCHQIK